MRNKTDLMAIYNAALQEAESTPNEINIKGMGVTLKKGRRQPYDSGTHRIKSKYGGTSFITYKKFVFGNLSICLLLNTDNRSPTLEFSLISDKQQAYPILIHLTKKYWHTTSFADELQKAYCALSLDFETAVSERNYDAVIKMMPDDTYIEWAIHRITAISEKQATETEKPKSILRQREALLIQASELLDEFNALVSEEIKQTIELEERLFRKYL